MSQLQKPVPLFVAIRFSFGYDAVESMTQGIFHVSFGLRRFQDRHRSVQFAYDGANDGRQPFLGAYPQ